VTVWKKGKAQGVKAILSLRAITPTTKLHYELSQELWYMENARKRVSGMSRKGAP
jgi:hypothetical protein